MNPAAALLLTISTLAPAALTAESLVADLERRLAAGGAEQVNAYLSSNWSSVMAPLNQKTAGCDLQAVSLSMQLSRSLDTKAAQAHGDSLRAATGKCMRFVLALATIDELPTYCSSVETWSPSQTARELRRRIAAIDADAILRSSQRGKGCRAAYMHELRNTRVGLKTRS